MKTRIKMHDFPGDIPKCDKIELLEKHRQGGKSFRKMLMTRERAIIKERTKKEISQQID